MIHWETLEHNQFINAQQQCVTDATAQIRPELTDVTFLHDNAQPHVAKFTLEKFLELDQEIFLYPPYLPDRHQARQNLNGKIYATDDELKTVVGDFFDSKPAGFYNKCIVA